MMMRMLRGAVPPALKAWLKGLRPRRGHQRPPGLVASDSFGVLVDERKEWLFANLPAAAAEYHYDIFLKTSQKRHARRLGLEVATDYLTNATLEEAIAYIEETRLERFVIKPNSSYSGIGCRMLIRENGDFRDLQRDRRIRTTQLRRELGEEQIRGRTDDWLVEELLLPADGSIAVIEDYKFYCFGGVAELIAHRRPVKRSRKRFRYRYTRDWELVQVGLDDRNDGIPHVPENARQLVTVAESAASQLCYPFIRIDLYDTSRGIVLGEFTPGPGQRFGFDAEWNARFVRRWHEAADAIVEGIRSGRITPLGPEVVPDPLESTVTPPSEAVVSA
ncbi:MAG: ATP-grasp fold amidoligase family protein [Trueperaceae bacterium]